MVNNHIIDIDTRSLIASRYKRITKAINQEFWNSYSETAHSIYVGSYGRGTAISTSDLDVLIELPDTEFEHFSKLYGNGQSRLLQVVKNAILSTYPNTDIKGDGQVVVVNFSDGMKFEILPAFLQKSYYDTEATYKYPDTHMGGNWMTTNPKAEQSAMRYKNDESNDLLFATCKHIRYIRNTYFGSYHLSGILIDSFCYTAIDSWHYLKPGEQKSFNGMRYEEALLGKYSQNTVSFGNTVLCRCDILAPGSRQIVDTSDWATLGKVLNKIVRDL